MTTVRRPPAGRPSPSARAAEILTVPGPGAGPGTFAFRGHVATNPRIEDLRKRIEKDPGSRLFAQLAEELRKDGELEDAIRVAREGLQKHPSYPSARMTLGRALLDTGDWPAARTEFELVLKSASENLAAIRGLAEIHHRRHPQRFGPGVCR